MLLHPAVRHRVAALLALRFAVAARRTTTPVRLLLNEYVRHRGRTDTYIIRTTGVPVVMQHGRDLEALFELFERGEYEPPGEVAPLLEASRVQQIVDVGANVGMFSAWATGRWPGADITAFEPARDNVPVYRQWARGRDHVTFIEAAAATADGTLRFADGFGGGSHVAPEGSRASRCRRSTSTPTCATPTSSRSTSRAVSGRSLPIRGWPTSTTWCS